MTFGPLVDAAWLLERLGEPELAVVDCRFVLGDPAAGERAYGEGHIPGAARLDVDRDLSAPPGAGGRHPLPRAEDFEAGARRAGIGEETPVVAYDEAGEGGAVRLWWLLRHFGHDRVAVLDGGLAGWREAGGPLRAGPREAGAAGGAEAARAGAAGAEAARPADADVDAAPMGDFVARAREGDTVSAAEIALGAPRLLDARAPERYRGEVEPVDPVAGHIPGAANVPWARVAPQGRFRDPVELRERLGDEPFVAYCGSGVTACTLVLAAELAGVDARLYPGGWSEWSALQQA